MIQLNLSFFSHVFFFKSLGKFYTLILRNINTNMTTENGRFRKISFKSTKKTNFKSTGTLTEQNNNKIPDIQ